MPRRAPVLLPLLASLLLAACSSGGGAGGGGTGGEQPPVVTPPVTTTPTTLADATFAAGRGLTVAASADFTGSGTWRVQTQSLPSWLRVTPLAGTGPVSLTVSLDRTLATPLAADQAALSGVVKLAWTGGTSASPQSGVAAWTVTADQFVLRGRVVAPASAQGGDVREGQTAPVTPRQPDGVIVTYRTSVSGLDTGGFNDRKDPKVCDLT